MKCRRKEENSMALCLVLVSSARSEGQRMRELFPIT